MPEDPDVIVLKPGPGASEDPDVIVLKPGPTSASTLRSEVGKRVAKPAKGFLTSFAEWANPLAAAPASDWPVAGPKFRQQLSDVGGMIAGEPARIWDSLSKSGKAMTEADLPGAAYHLAGAVPLFGPAAQQITEEVGQGSTPEAAGHFASLLTPAVVTAAGGKMASGRNRPVPTTPSGIPKSFSERQPTSGWRGFTERLIENRPTGRKPQEEFRVGQAGKAKEVVSAVSDTLGPAHTAEEAGIAAGNVVRSSVESRQSSLNARTEAANAARVAEVEAANAKRLGTMESTSKAAQAKLEADRLAAVARLPQAEATFYEAADRLGPSAEPKVHGAKVKAQNQVGFEKFKKTTGDLFGEVDSLVGRPLVSTKGIKDVANDLLTDLRGTGGIIGSDEATKTIRMLENMVGGVAEDGTPTGAFKELAGFRQLQIIRSEMLRQLRKVDSLLPGRYTGAEKKLVPAFTDAMNEAAAQGGGAPAVEALAKANKFLRENAKTWQEGIAVDIMDALPEDVAGLVWRKDKVTEPAILLNLIKDNPEAVSALRRSGMDQIIKKATTATGNLNGRIVAREIRNLGETGKLLFGNPDEFIQKANAVESAHSGIRAAEKAKLKTEKFKPEQAKLAKPPGAPVSPHEAEILKAANEFPEKMAEGVFLQGGGSESLARSTRSMLVDHPDLWDGLRRSAWEKIVEDSMDSPRVANRQPSFNTRKFVDNWETVRPEVREILAGGSDGLKRINELMMEMRQVDTSKAAKLGTPVTGFVEPVTLLSGHFGATGLTLALPRMISEAMVNPNLGKSKIRSMGRVIRAAGQAGVGVGASSQLTPPPK